MGLIINVFRNDNRDCTNGGVSSKAKELCVINAEGPFDPKEDDGVFPVKLIDHPGLPGTPLLVPTGGRKGMMGGNFGYTSDGRFQDKIVELTGRRFYGAVPIHDRFE